MKKTILSLIGLSIFILFWYLFSCFSVILIVKPHLALLAFFKLIITKKVWAHIIITLYRTIVGFSIALIIGIPIGLIIGFIVNLQYTFESIIDFLRSIPATALLPLFIVVFGISDMGKISLVAFASILIVLVYTMLGVKNCNKERQRFARTIGANKSVILYKIVFFESLPSTFAGIRTSISLSFVLVIVAEMIMFGTENGLGIAIFESRYRSSYQEMYAYIIICGLLGFVLNKGFKMIGDRIVHWIQ